MSRTNGNEEALPGNATSSVVRIGDTVRRPVGPWTDSVDALLAHLEAVGFTGAPRPLGRDAAGRQVLQFIEGTVGDPSPHYSPAELHELGQLLRTYHDAVVSFEPPPGAVWNQVLAPDAAELIGHGDPAPWNLVRAEHGWVLIDWDAAGPCSRLWDLAYLIQTTVPLADGRPVRDCAAGAAAVADGYGLSREARDRLPEVLHRRTAAMHTRLRDAHRRGEQPWARIYLADGAYWQRAAAFVAANIETWRNALAPTGRPPIS